MSSDNTLDKKVMAQTLLSRGRYPEAKVLLRQACEADPRDPEAWYGLGLANGLIGDFMSATACFERVVRLNPGSAGAYRNLAKALVKLGRFEEAVAAYRGVLRIAPADLETHRYLNATLERMGRLDEARAGYERMLELSPGNPDILAAIARLFEVGGDRQRAREALMPLVRQSPDNPKVAIAFAAVCEGAEECDHAISMLERIAADPKTGEPSDIESEIHFALGRLYDERKAYDQAFGHYQQANRVKGASFDLDEFARHVDEVIRTFSAEAMTRAPSSTIPTGTAVFIVGMPRSGTSLVEQILASHPDVAAGGELYEFTNLVIEIRDLVASRSPYPRYLAELTGDVSNTAARRYLEQLRGISATRRYVTNKMPHNFLYLGLISMILPQARIIHCRRDPRDACLSCFFQDFTRGHDYCYELETLGAYYRQYQRLMAHWEQVIEPPFFALNYEKLVTDQEGQTRRLLAYLDLPWDDDCLQFHKTGRLIQTASYDQVRRPLYGKSVGRWKNYERHLQPLLKGLGSPVGP